jgi:hypothetical protein
MEPQRQFSQGSGFVQEKQPLTRALTLTFGSLLACLISPARFMPAGANKYS